METVRKTMDNVKVNPYLTYSQIQAIANEVCKFDSWAEREQTIDIMLIHFATDITDSELESIGIDYMLQSGMVDAIKAQIINFCKIQEAVSYTESVQRSLSKIVKDMPKILEPLEQVIIRGNKSSEK